MASTYTDGLAVEIIGSGDKAGSWGDVTNNNLKALEEGISRYAEIGAAGSNTSTLNIPDGQTAYTDDSKGRSAVIKWTGAIASGDSHTVTLQVGGAEATQARFTAINGLSSSKDLVIDTASGTSLTIPNGYSADIHLDGSGNVVNSFSGLAVDKLALKNNEIISNETNDQIVIAADTVKVGDDGAATLSSNGDQDLILKTGNSTTGNITLVDGSNGDISITPEGSGKVVMDKVNIGGGEIDGTPIGANAASTGAFTSATVDDIVLDGKVITMTGDTGDTATFTAGTNGTLDIATTDAGGTAANIQITADGTAELAGTSVTLDASSNITLDADGGTVTFADNGVSLGTITSSGYSGTAATVTTNANLTGPVTSSGNATTIASGVVTGSNFNITSGSVSGDYLLAADGTGGGLKWIEQPAGDITGVTAGTNLNGGGSEGAVTVNLDSAISLANVTTSSKIIVGADSDFTTGTAYIASQGGVRSSTYTSRTANQSMSISPNGTGSLNLSSTGTAGPNSKINIQCSTAPILIEASSSTTANSIIIFRSGGSATADSKLVIQDTGPRMPEPSSGNHYFNVSSEGGTTGTGLRNSTDGTLEIRSKNSSTADGWGRAYHSGMVSGDGAYIEIVSSSILANTDGGTTAHGMGQTPRIVTVEARCKVAEYGYSVDDIVYVGYGSMSDNRGVTVSANATTIQFSIGSGGIEIIERDPSGTNGQQGLDNDTNWELKIRAWK